VKVIVDYTSQEDDSAGTIMTNTIKNVIFCKKEHNATRGKIQYLSLTM
jgi:hypothetical protein